MQLVNGFNHQSRSPRCDACGGPPGKTVPSDPDSLDRPVLDLGIYVDHEGAVNICMTCAEEVGSLAGCISAEKSEDLVKSAAELAEDLAYAQAEVQALEFAFAALMEIPAFAVKAEAPAAEPEKAPAKKAPAKKAAAVKKAAA